MSSVSSPVHRFSSDFDSFYDPNFTVDISTKMRVPRTILVTDEASRQGQDSVSHVLFPHVSLPDLEKLPMEVPDRIVVAGQEQHLGLKAPPRELKLEQTLQSQSGLIRVETPPRVLTLEEHRFPTVDDFPAEEKGPHNDADGIHKVSFEPFRDDVHVISPELSPSEDIRSLHKELTKLRHRIVVLEADSQQRQQREVILYTLGIAYVVLKTLLWLQRHW